MRTLLDATHHDGELTERVSLEADGDGSVYLMHGYEDGEPAAPTVIRVPAALVARVGVEMVLAGRVVA